MNLQQQIVFSNKTTDGKTIFFHSCSFCDKKLIAKMCLYISGYVICHECLKLAAKLTKKNYAKS